ncbi:RAB7A-interacting MON1-CCZ1 complex subunit 1-like [Dermacentor albipictus]|uniref:RAB7A-interacting MON1-CCZ1 complex subunit 1-like n=1 Tax=Dermacentor albipictus TaxID=60249 RepID=UPI0038FC4CF3
MASSWQISHSPLGFGGIAAGEEHLLAPESLPLPKRLPRWALSVQQGSDFFPQLSLAFHRSLWAGHAGPCHEERMLLHEGDQQVPLVWRDVRAQSHVLVGRHYAHKQDRARAKVVEGLGEELAECIEWRKGGLVYMFCQSKEGDDDHSWLTANQETFFALLQQGVHHLTAMLNVRRPLSAEDVTVLSGQTDVLELLEKGIYSDGHALSLMYAGEMCYWLVTYSKRWDRPLEMAHALPLGKRLLQDYISAVEGPLQGAGWNCTRARQLLAQLGEVEQC